MTLSNASRKAMFAKKGVPSKQNFNSKRSRRKLRIKNLSDEERFKENEKFLKRTPELDLFKHLHNNQDRQTKKQIKDELFQNPHRQRGLIPN